MTELDVIKKKIRVRLNELADTLADGGAHDFNEYKYITGIIHGLAIVERDILDLEKLSDDEA